MQNLIPKTSEQIIDDILNEVRIEALNFVRYCGYGHIELQINFHKKEVSEIYNLRIDRNKSIKNSKKDV